MKVDVAIIGAGSAGLSARREVERRGRSWVMIDSGPLGTTCARVGCMPSKLLIAAADARRHVLEAEAFGVRVSGAEVDGRAVMARVRSERDRFVRGVTSAIESLGPEAVLRGRARFAGPTSLRVEDAAGGPVDVEARAVVVATGSGPFVPSELEPVRDRVMLNDDLFELEDLPRSVAVVGTGVIALELGQALHRLGVRVGFFNPFDEVGPTSDPVVTQSVRAVLGAELEIHAGVRSLSWERSEAGVRARWVEAGLSYTDEYEWVLAAAGRRANLDGLGLEHAGVPLDERGRPQVDPRTMQVGAAPIFLAGDVTGDRPLLHEASDEGRIAGRNAAAWPEDVLAHVRRTPLAIAFTDPNIALVGARYADLEQGEFEVGTIDFASQGRSRVMAQNRGVSRLYAERATGRLLGAELFGPRMEHGAHPLSWAIAEGMTVQRAIQMPFYHPVIEEGLRTALRDVASRLEFASAPCASGLDCGPGS